MVGHLVRKQSMEGRLQQKHSMELCLIRKHRGIKWLHAKLATSKAKSDAGDDADEKSIMAESSRLIEKGVLSPNYVYYGASTPEEDDNESFDVKVFYPPARSVLKTAKVAKNEPSEMEILSGFVLSVGLCHFDA